jgi:hypothetical protein
MLFVEFDELHRPVFGRSAVGGFGARELRVAGCSDFVDKLFFLLDKLLEGVLALGLED